MKRHVAEEALAALQDASMKMNTTLLMIQQECTEEALVKFRRGTGLAMGYLYTEVIMPILQEHPGLEPDETREPFQE
jgi:hypothetical protein